ARSARGLVMPVRDVGVDRLGGADGYDGWLGLTGSQDERQIRRHAARRSHQSRSRRRLEAMPVVAPVRDERIAGGECLGHVVAAQPRARLLLAERRALLGERALGALLVAGSDVEELAMLLGGIGARTAHHE